MKLFIAFLLLLISIPAFSSDQAQYQAAVIDAAMHRTYDAKNPNPKLTLMSGKRARFVVFTAYDYQQTRGDKPLSNTLWVTAEPDLKNKCHAYLQSHRWANHHQLTVWITKLLGLPIDDQIDQYHFVILSAPVIQAYVNRSSQIGIFRPCTDPRIDYQGTDQRPTCPYQFPLGSDDHSTAGYKTWFINNMIDSYQNNGWPWTGYGYTYDWNPGVKNHYGMSEFVILQNTPATLLPSPYDTKTTRITLEQYCASP